MIATGDGRAEAEICGQHDRRLLQALCAQVQQTLPDALANLQFGAHPLPHQLLDSSPHDRTTCRLHDQQQDEHDQHDAGGQRHVSPVRASHVGHGASSLRSTTRIATDLSVMLSA